MESPVDSPDTGMTDARQARLLRELCLEERLLARRMAALAASARDAHTRDQLEHQAAQCERRAATLCRATNTGPLPQGSATPASTAAPSGRATLLIRLLGVDFHCRLLERRLNRTAACYAAAARNAPALAPLARDARTSAQCFADIGVEGDAAYCMSAIVLGLNDALVELTGALAGFTMVLHDNRLIGLAGFTTGIAATLSMAASEFFSQKASASRGRARKAAAYTGVAYLVTVLLLLLPYALLPTPGEALALCMGIAGLIILAFTWVDALVCRTPFWRNFLQMLGISFGVALIIFLVSWLARVWLHVEV